MNTRRDLCPQEVTNAPTKRARNNLSSDPIDAEPEKREKLGADDGEEEEVGRGADANDPLVACLLCDEDATFDDKSVLYQHFFEHAPHLLEVEEKDMLNIKSFLNCLTLGLKRHFGRLVDVEEMQTRMIAFEAGVGSEMKRARFGQKSRGHARGIKAYLDRHKDL